MSEMTADIMQAAKAAAYATEATGDDTAAITSVIGVDVIARAILKERERCAQIAEAKDRVGREWVPDSLWDRIKRETAADIRSERQP